MFNEESYITQFTDMMNEGFIFIDEYGKIQIYNNKAKEIFGITFNQGMGHEPGKINHGDIVIIGDNSLGRDDGGLSMETLGVIGMEDQDINPSDALIAIGVYKDKNKPVICKYEKSHGNMDELSLDTVFEQVSLGIKIDFTKRCIHINVGSQAFDMDYINAVGHMVVVDGHTKAVKFYQAQGYTARGESIKDLLMGKSFRGKGLDHEILDVMGKDIFEIHDPGPTIKEFYEAARGMDISYREKFTEINGRPTLCTLMPVSEKGKRVGAALKVEDISMLRKVMKERDEALFHLEQMIKEEEDTSKLFPEIIGDSREMINVKKLALKASKSNSTILILGESGTGKSILAKAIHNRSKYQNKPFVHVNCGSIPEELLESELFGYEGGAFTGANREGKPGLFEVAKGGTIFLDEIGEIRPSIQVKLLKVLQNKTFYRVGGIREISIDVRIMAATNKKLEQEMAEGRFREDFYYRINVFPIWIPPLRERKQDIYSIVNWLLPKICDRLEYEMKSISGEALYHLIGYDWPGNVRELENALERAVNLTEDRVIQVEHLTINNQQKDKKEIKTFKEAVLDAEKKILEDALSFYDGNRAQVMKVLNMGKTNFYEKLKKYDLK